MRNREGEHEDERNIRMDTRCAERVSVIHSNSHHPIADQSDHLNPYQLASVSLVVPKCLAFQQPTSQQQWRKRTCSIETDSDGKSGNLCCRVQSTSQQQTKRSAYTVASLSFATNVKRAAQLEAGSMDG